MPTSFIWVERSWYAVWTTCITAASLSVQPGPSNTSAVHGSPPPLGDVLVDRFVELEDAIPHLAVVARRSVRDLKMKHDVCALDATPDLEVDVPVLAPARVDSRDDVELGVPPEALDHAIARRLELLIEEPADRALEESLGLIWVLPRRALVRANLRGHSFKLLLDADDVRLLVDVRGARATTGESRDGLVVQPARTGRHAATPAPS
jgi:hypothetical protein